MPVNISNLRILIFQQNVSYITGHSGVIHSENPNVSKHGGGCKLAGLRGYLLVLEDWFSDIAPSPPEKKKRAIFFNERLTGSSSRGSRCYEKELTFTYFLVCLRKAYQTMTSGWQRSTVFWGDIRGGSWFQNRRFRRRKVGEATAERVSAGSQSAVDTQASMRAALLGWV